MYVRGGGGKREGAGPVAKLDPLLDSKSLSLNPFWAIGLVIGTGHLGLDPTSSQAYPWTKIGPKQVVG